MKTVVVNVVSFAMGVLAGSLSGYSLISQVAQYTTKPSRFGGLYPLVRIVSIGLLGWFLLRWGTLAFILFGGTMLITMWIVIITFNK